MWFDVMYVVIGFYVIEILENCLGVVQGIVVNGVFLFDFGKGYFDFNLIWVKELMDLMMGDVLFDFGVVLDGDGDCNMIVGCG